MNEKTRQWNELKGKFNEQAFKFLEYRIHYDNGGVSPWYGCLSNDFVELHLYNSEFRYSDLYYSYMTGLLNAIPTT